MFFHEFGEKFKFSVTQVIGLTNDDEVSKEFRPYKQMIERLNRTYTHKHTNFKPLNEVDILKGTGNMPGKWQLPIALGQQTILNLQEQACA